MQSGNQERGRVQLRSSCCFKEAEGTLRTWPSSPLGVHEGNSSTHQGASDGVYKVPCTGNTGTPITRTYPTRVKFGTWRSSICWYLGQSSTRPTRQYLPGPDCLVQRSESLQGRNSTRTTLCYCESRWNLTFGIGTGSHPRGFWSPLVP